MSDFKRAFFTGTPPPPPNLKPYRVYYTLFNHEINTVVYAADEDHAREMAPQMFLGQNIMLVIVRVERIKDYHEY